jgi:hypothetical protein
MNEYGQQEDAQQEYAQQEQRERREHQEDLEAVYPDGTPKCSGQHSGPCVDNGKPVEIIVYAPGNAILNGVSLIAGPAEKENVQPEDLNVMWLTASGALSLLYALLYVLTKQIPRTKRERELLIKIYNSINEGSETIMVEEGGNNAGFSII